MGKNYDRRNTRAERTGLLATMFLAVIITAAVMLSWFAIRDSFIKKQPVPRSAPIAVQGVY